jgi:hypothetical protein
VLPAIFKTRFMYTFGKYDFMGKRCILILDGGFTLSASSRPILLIELGLTVVCSGCENSVHPVCIYIIIITIHPEKYMNEIHVRHGRVEELSPNNHTNHSAISKCVAISQTPNILGTIHSAPNQEWL